MCGIAGLIYFDKNKTIDSSTIKKMTNAISHRGPDDEGIYLDKNVGLGFRRLSIIDVNLGHQPLSNEDDKIHIVFNGEIYNYLDNKDFLLKKGYKFKTATDTEVILHLYEEFGEQCTKYLRGMFAFVIWDNKKNKLFCARDRFGIKPFYYYLDNEKFIFGSEIKSILKVDKINKEISFDALNSYFSFGYISSDLSIYTSIKKLLPSHTISIQLNKDFDLNIQRYWSIHFEPDYSKNERQWQEEIQNTISETVKRHMISDVPLGAFLSGGIDSSSVVANMALNSDQPIKTFSIGFKEEKYNELHYAKELAKMYKCEYHEQIIDPESIGIISKLVEAYDEPFSDTSAIPTYYVSKFAREHVTVALSGDGGDELFAGYTEYNYLKKLKKYISPSPLFNKFFWGTIYNSIPQNFKGTGVTYYLSKNRDLIGSNVCLWQEKERNKLYKDIVQKKINIKNTEIFKENILKDGQKQGYDFISNLQNLDLQTYMVDSILTKVDRASMMNSLEVRVPLLDHKFAELTFKIPWELKIKNMEQKYIFKKSMAELLPKSILNHEKQGFGVPLSIWFKDDLKEYINDNLLTNNAKLINYLHKDYIKYIVSLNQSGNRNFSVKIWSLLFFEEWLKQNS